MDSTYLKGTKIDLTTPEQVVAAIEQYDFQSGAYISLFGLYVLSESFRNIELQRALNESWINPVHGKSIEFYLRIRDSVNIKTVDGIYLLDKLLKSDLSHYFYGTSSSTLSKIKNRVDHDYPTANILGYKAPPLFDIKNIPCNSLLESDFNEISETDPDIVWIGLGGVKQDLVMYHYSKECPNSIMIGVGAVFDYFTGNLSLSPEWVKSLGLRWLYRGFVQPSTFKRIIRTFGNFTHLFIKS